MQSSEEPHSNDHAVEFFRRLSHAKQATAPKPLKPSSPRLVGLVLGATLGLVYGVVSQVVNQLLMPGVPFAQYPLGLAGNCLVIIVSGAVIGLACVIPRSSVNGAFLGSVVIVAAVILQWWTAHATSSAILLESPFITPLTPFEIGLLFILFIPFMALFRLAADIQTESSHRPVWAWARLRIPLLILALTGTAGAFSLYPDHVRQAMADMHALIQTGLSVPDAAHLPPSLWEEHGVTGFLDYATSDYTLEQSQDTGMKYDLGDLPETYSLVIIARFKSNWIVACLYDVAGNRSQCKSYVTPVFFLITGLDRGRASLR
jgi:hypothetical protein